MVIKKVFAAALLATVTACNAATGPLSSQSVPIFTSSNATALGSTVEVRIETGTQLKTLAAKKTIADVHHYHIKLINTTTGVVMAEGDSTDLVSFFQKVPNGTYKVNVDALDATGNSIVQGGAQDSSNTVTVAAPNVTYSDGGPCLKVRLKLLNATGEKVGNSIVVDDGDEWTGTPELQPGGNCPCPTPTPSPSINPSPSTSPSPSTGYNVSALNWGMPLPDGLATSNSGLNVWKASVSPWYSFVTIDGFDLSQNDISLTWTPDQSHMTIVGLSQGLDAYRSAMRGILIQEVGSADYAYYPRGTAQWYTQIPQQSHSTNTIKVINGAATYYRDNVQVYAASETITGIYNVYFDDESNVGAQASNISITVTPH